LLNIQTSNPAIPLKISHVIDQQVAFVSLMIDRFLNAFPELSLPGAYLDIQHGIDLTITL
jgi:hypothetical protein